MPLLCLLALGGAGIAQNAEAQAGESRAGLVIQFGDGSVRQYCLAFPGETTTGLDLLLQTGLDVKIEATGGMGGLICKIGPDGCDYPAEHCVCESFGPNGVYWSYHHLKEGRWSTSVLGASSYKVRDGDVEGWAWSEGSPPPLFTFNQICGEKAAQPTDTVPPAPPTSVPTQTKTRPVPTATQPPHTPTLTATATAAGASQIEPTVTLPLPQTPTISPSPTSTEEPTATWAANNSPTATSTATEIATATASPTTTSATEGRQSSLDLCIVGILAGVGAAASFAFALMLISRRGRGDGDVG